MKVLFIGGTGVISKACSLLAIKNNLDLTILTRNPPSNLGNKINFITGDIRDKYTIIELIKDLSWDCIVDFISYTTDHIESSIELFKDKTNQYIFISSASTYRKPVSHLPVKESNCCHNPNWKYSQNKILCENLLLNAYRDNNFPVTIVRPSHTYDETILPLDGEHYIIERMLNNQEVIIHGDGTSLWTLTHSEDFAIGLIGLLGNDKTIGEIYHITNDEWLTWNEIYNSIGSALGVRPKLLYVPSTTINKFNKEWGACLLGDKSHSMIFDNSKIKEIVPNFRCSIPFHKGIKRTIDWQLSNIKKLKKDFDFIDKYEKIINFIK